MSSHTPTIVAGIGVSPGRVVARCVLMPDQAPEPPSGRRLAPGEDVVVAAQRIHAASQRVREALDLAADTATGTAQDLLRTTAAIAADPSLVADAERRVTTDNLVPERAVWEAAEAVSAQFTALGGYFAERAGDIADVRDRLVAELTGMPAPGIPTSTEPFVLVASDLAPALTATLDPRNVLAFVTIAGGPTSHTAILARARGIPAVVAARDAGTGSRLKTLNRRVKLRVVHRPHDVSRVNLRVVNPEDGNVNGGDRTSDAVWCQTRPSDGFRHPRYQYIRRLQECAVKIGGLVLSQPT